MYPSKERVTSRPSAGKRQSKQHLRERARQEVEVLGLSQPSQWFRDSGTGIRIPPPCTRVLQTNAKGKWCGKSALNVVKEEFDGVAKDLDNILVHSLLRLNDKPLALEDEVKIKNMDVIKRVIHWHEPPILVPDKLFVEKLKLPDLVVKEYNLQGSFVMVCDKPATVPVHPAGPFFANSLTCILEAEQGLEPKSIYPCHRIDRATSGLTICTTDVSVSRLIQRKMDEGNVKKMYVAKVKGRFPSSEAEVKLLRSGICCSFDDGVVEINAPVRVNDPKKGLREISTSGKPSKSRFQLLTYDSKDGHSLISCFPITGRGHQLRVHLQSLGHPIVDDVLYGGTEVDSVVRKKAIESILQVCNRVESQKFAQDLSIADVQSAKSSCQICNKGTNGITSSFTSAQLLGGGHAISLHALRYEIRFPQMKNKDASLGSLRMEVDLPFWAKSIQKEDLCWL
mmetsp:Transcript_30899/g.46919  ORF Transcript_30899/g.46919 Transcript_30899/m.46919 type:complete len:453 (+) Transcript_30899:335-1693(+)